MPSQGHFYGLESGNKLYKIYVTESALCGAKIAGAIYDAKSARLSMSHLGLLGLLLSQAIGGKHIKKRVATEEKVDAMQTGGPIFMGADKANFSLGQSAISRIDINPPRKGLKNVLKSQPAVELHLSDGKKRRFILIDEQNVEYIRDLLARVVPATTLIE